MSPHLPPGEESGGRGILDYYLDGSLGDPVVDCLICTVPIHGMGRTNLSRNNTVGDLRDVMKRALYLCITRPIEWRDKQAQITINVQVRL